MAARHEQWVVELLAGLSRDEKETMISALGKVKTRINNTAPLAAKRQSGRRR
jgi:hypothetical protein